MSQYVFPSPRVNSFTPTNCDMRQTFVVLSPGRQITSTKRVGYIQQVNSVNLCNKTITVMEDEASQILSTPAISTLKSLQPQQILTQSYPQNQQQQVKQQQQQQQQQQQVQQQQQQQLQSSQQSAHSSFKHLKQLFDGGLAKKKGYRQTNRQVMAQTQVQVPTYSLSFQMGEQNHQPELNEFKVLHRKEHQVGQNKSVQQFDVIKLDHERRESDSPRNLNISRLQQESTQKTHEESQTGSPNDDLHREIERLNYTVEQKNHQIDTSKIFLDQLQKDLQGMLLKNQAKEKLNYNLRQEVLSLQMKNSELMREVEQLRNPNEKGNSIDNLDHRWQDYQGLNSVVSKECEVLKLQNKSLELKVVRLQEEIDEAAQVSSTKIREYEIEIERLDKKLNDEFQERQRLEVKIQKIMKEKQDYQTQILRKRRELEEFRESSLSTGTLNQLQNYQSTSQSEENFDQELINTLKQKLKDLSRENQALKSRHQQTEHSESCSEENQNQLRSENQRLRKLNQDLQKKLSKIQQMFVQTKIHFEDTQKQVETLKTRVDSFEKQINLFSHESYSQSSELDKLRLEQQEFLKQIKRLKDSTDVHYSQIIQEYQKLEEIREEDEVELNYQFINMIN